MAPSQHRSAHRQSIFGGVKAFLTASACLAASASPTRSLEMSSASADGLFADLSNRVSLEDSLIFPTEIFQTILWQLRDDIPTLRVCSLVSKPFSQLSQRLLFREIVLEDRPPKTPPAPSVRSSSSSIRSSFSGRKTPSERLHRLFSNSPHLAKYARSLTLQCGSGSKGDSWIMSDDFLHLIVPLMNRLDRFTFTSTARGKRALDFVRLPLSVREALVEVLQLPGIKALSIEGLEHIPIPVFNACTMVERLTLAFYSLSDGTKREFSDLLLPPTPSTGRLCRLRTLGLHHCSKHHLRTLQWLAHAHCPFNLNKIKKLEYSSEDDEHEACFKALLKGMPWTLQSLSYTPPLHASTVFPLRRRHDPWSPNFPDVSLERFSELRSLVLGFNFRKTTVNPPDGTPGAPAPFTGYANALPFLVRLLQTLPAPNRLRSMTIAMRFSRVDEDAVSQVDWEDVVNCLRSGKFPSWRLLRLEPRGDDGLPTDRICNVLRTNAVLLEGIWGGFVVLM